MFMKKRFFALIGASILLTLSSSIYAGETIGEVSTVFKLLTPNHKIVVDAYDDPKVAGVTCYVSRAKTGGVKGALGVAEDRAEASIACVATGAMEIKEPLRQQEEIFSERTSLLFKRLRVVRMVDKQRRALVYMSYSDRIIEGHPQNSVTAVAVPENVELKMR